MSRFKPSILSYAVAVLSLPVMANYNNDSMDDIGKIDGKVQSVYFDQESKNASQVTEHSGAWTGALWLNAETAHFADMVGFGASFYEVVKIDMKDRNEREGGSGGLLNNSHEGFGNLGQLWIDLQFPDNHDGYSANLKAGRQLVETGLITISGSRSVPSAWQGADAAVTIDDFSGKIAWVDKVSKRTQSGFHDIRNNNDEKIDNIIGMELSYTFDLGNQKSLELQYRNGLADKYLQSHNGNVTFKMPLYNGSELTLGAMYYHAKEDGKRWDLQNSAFEKKGESSGVNATWDCGVLSLNAAFTYSKAKVSSKAAPVNGYHPIGYYDYYFGANTQGAFGMPTSSIYSDFNFDEEIAFLIGGEYDFSNIGLNGLSLGYNFIHGSGMKAKNVDTKKSKDVTEYEHDVTVKYNFANLGLKDLNLKTQYAYNHNDKEFRKATGQGSAKYLRAWLSYSFEI